MVGTEAAPCVGRFLRFSAKSNWGDRGKTCLTNLELEGAPSFPTSNTGAQHGLMFELENKEQACALQITDFVTGAGAGANAAPAKAKAAALAAAGAGAEAAAAAPKGGKDTGGKDKGGKAAPKVVGFQEAAPAAVAVDVDVYIGDGPLADCLGDRSRWQLVGHGALIEGRVTALTVGGGGRFKPPPPPPPLKLGVSATGAKLKPPPGAERAAAEAQRLAAAVARAAAACCIPPGQRRAVYLHARANSCGVGFRNAGVVAASTLLGGVGGAGAVSAASAAARDTLQVQDDSLRVHPGFITSNDTTDKATRQPTPTAEPFEVRGGAGVCACVCVLARGWRWRLGTSRSRLSAPSTCCPFRALVLCICLTLLLLLPPRPPLQAVRTAQTFAFVGVVQYLRLPDENSRR